MKIEDIGEFGIIDRIKRRLKTGPGVFKGIGDDCAVVAGWGKWYVLLTCDMIVEGVDFTRAERLRLVGRKALAVAISDIAACGGLPRYALVTLGLPKGFPVRGVDELYRGMAALAGRFGVNIVGGDISRSPRLLIDVSLYGQVEKRKLVLRSGAREGDVVFVTGAFGGSRQGKHLTFTPRVAEARFLVDNFKLNAMIDCSDGLAADLQHILAQSGVGCVLFERLIPREKSAAGTADALFSGEDFELIFTASGPESRRILAAKKFRFRPIGLVTAPGSGMRIIDGGGVWRKLEPKGFKHF